MRIDPRSRGVVLWKEYDDLGIQRCIAHFPQFILPSLLFTSCLRPTWARTGELAPPLLGVTCKASNWHFLAPDLLLYRYRNIAFLLGRAGELTRGVARFLNRARAEAGGLGGNDFFTDLNDLADASEPDDRPAFEAFRRLHAALSEPSCTLDNLRRWIAMDGVIIWACSHVWLKMHPYFVRPTQARLPGHWHSGGAHLEYGESRFALCEAYIKPEWYRRAEDDDLAVIEEGLLQTKRIVLSHLWLHRDNALVDTGQGLIIGSPMEIVRALPDLWIDKESAAGLATFLKAVMFPG